ncbi:MAG: VirB3 family type IV secretion system protein [Pseudomonadota bacterium]
MPDRTPLFLGLARPPRYLGLPIGYLVVLALGVFLPFIFIQHPAILLLALPPYAVLWVLADREPAFFEILAVSLGAVPGTANRGHWGGDSYGV